jgi:predicted amidophosphoribosyltransferase
MRTGRRNGCRPRQIMMRKVAFASCYVYSPCGSCPSSERSRLLRALLKAGDARFIFKYALRVRQQASECSVLAGFFDASDVLIPVPGSEPRSRSASSGMSVTEHLAAALVREGLGRCAWAGLHRVSAVSKSATAAAGERPTVGKHYDSFAVECVDEIPGAAQIVLIDDVVTKGRTLLAAATRLHEAFPRARIRAFALLRTMGLIPDVNQLLDPCIGEIRWRGGDAHRKP